MTTQVVTVPVGAPQIFRPGPNPYNVFAAPGATGTVLVEVSRDNGTTFVASSIGTSATGAGYGVSGYGDYGTQVRVTASTVAATAYNSDLSYPVGGANVTISGATLVNWGVPIVTPNSTSELSVFSLRIPAGALKSNFMLDLDATFTATNNANVKTLKAYVGNAVNAAAAPIEGGTICATQVLTSSSGGRLALRVTGGNDNATIRASSIGAALGYGISTTAPISVTTSAVYAGASAVEQVLLITSTKATGTDTVSMDSCRINLTQS